LRSQRWEPLDRKDQPLEPVSTPEHKRPDLASIYALSKYSQERMCLMVGEAYGIDTVALRLFNVFGSRQALSNPYTGVLAIFASRLLNGKPPLVYEDGGQRRDFVNVRDVARACVLALENFSADGQTINVGSGQSFTVNEIARNLGETLGAEFEPEVTGKFRAGDIRHCFADISRARELLNYEPQVALKDGLVELAAWLETQSADDHFEAATHELVVRGLAR
jgi:dTDP-L-rhamnose 4-epimerase